jgi:hypothetical protein
MMLAMRHPKCWKWVREIWLVFVFGICMLEAHAQQPRSSPEFPKHPKEGEWLFSREAHGVWIYQSSAWKQLEIKDCRSFVQCNNHVIVKDGSTYLLADLKGNILSSKSPDIRCFHDFIIVGGQNHLDYLLNDRGDTLTPIVNNCKIFTDTLAGEAVFCFPAYSPGLEKYSCLELRNWGMMDAKGKWVIEPRFDRPFNFQNGKAEVKEKGIYRWIDENGETMENE